MCSTYLFRAILLSLFFTGHVSLSATTKSKSKYAEQSQSKDKYSDKTNSKAKYSEKYKGGIAGGGGGKNEPLFHEISKNILNWIESGDADQIEIPEEFNLIDYKVLMTRALTNYDISFTDDKVMVGGSEKTCRSYVDDSERNKIICNNSLFPSDTIDQVDSVYLLIHHEFASLACKNLSSGQFRCLENNQGSNSDYRISEHISEHLSATITKRLPIVKAQSRGNHQSPDTVDCDDYTMEFNKQLVGKISDSAIHLIKSELLRAFALEGIKAEYSDIHHESIHSVEEKKIYILSRIGDFEAVSEIEYSDIRYQRSIEWAGGEREVLAVPRKSDNSRTTALGEFIPATEVSCTVWRYVYNDKISTINSKTGKPILPRLQFKSYSNYISTREWHKPYSLNVKIPLIKLSEVK